MQMYRLPVGLRMGNLKIIANGEIARPVDVVRSQAEDIQHHISHNVHKSFKFTFIKGNSDATEYRQSVSLMGIPVSRSRVVQKTL